MLLGGGCYSEVPRIGNDMGKHLGLKVSGCHWEMAASQRWSLLEVQL